MKQLLLIGLGGGLGSIARYLTSALTMRYYTGGFPLATFSANILGCFLIGIFLGTFNTNDSNLRFFFITGFCGGYTTFSTFSAENYQLWFSNQLGLLLLNIAASVVVGFAGVWAGFTIARL